MGFGSTKTPDEKKGCLACRTLSMLAGRRSLCSLWAQTPSPLPHFHVCGEPLIVV
jgi:hypothetical protein